MQISRRYAEGAGGNVIFTSNNFVAVCLEERRGQKVENLCELSL